MNFEEYYKDKTVIIIGPGSNVYEECKKLDVNSFDILVRINHHHKYTTKEQCLILGNKTDVIYHCLSKLLIDKNEIVDWKNKNINVISRYPLHERNLQSFGVDFPFLYEIDDDYSFVNHLKEEMNCNPNTGVVSIFHILSFDVEKLCVVGFDFYQTLYLNEVEGKKDSYRKSMLGGEIGKENGVSHEPLKQLKYIKETIYKNDDRFIPVGKFKDLLEMK